MFIDTDMAVDTFDTDHSFVIWDESTLAFEDFIWVFCETCIDRAVMGTQGLESIN
jgi:hypothetical protein